MKNKFKPILILLFLTVMGLSLVACTMISDLVDVSLDRSPSVSSNSNIPASPNSNIPAAEEKKDKRIIIYSDDNFKVTYLGI